MLNKSIIVLIFLSGFVIGGIAFASHEETEFLTQEIEAIKQSIATLLANKEAECAERVGELKELHRHWQNVDNFLKKEKTQ